MRFKRMLERRAGSTRENAAETRERLLDAAERLFAEEGITRTSLRAITLAAGVNVAAIHYHFGSKEALLQGVFARRLVPVNQERLERLERIEAGAAGGALPLEPVLEAFLAPVLSLLGDADGGRLATLFGRLVTEPGELVARLMREQFREVADRFTAALRRALPELSETEVAWCLHCAIGVVGHCLASSHVPEVAREFGLPDDDEQVLLRRLTAFCAAGFRAAQAEAT
jgi:AcrR family transcriptional regulator